MPFVTTAFAHVVNYPHVEQCTFDTSNSSFTCNVGRDLICDQHAQFRMHFVNSSCAVKRLWQCGPHHCDKTKKVKTVEVPVTTTVTATETCTETVVETMTLPPVTVNQTITDVITSVTTATATATVTDTVTTTESVVIVETVCPTDREITIVEPSTSPSPTPTPCHYCPSRDISILPPVETIVEPSTSVVPEPTETPCPEDYTTPEATREVTIPPVPEPTETPCPDDYNTTVSTPVATREVTIVEPSTSVVPTETPCPEDYNTTVSTPEATRNVTISETTTTATETSGVTETTPTVTPYLYRRFFRGLF
ncbi:hypothetical protein EBU95_17760 [bacterium]|nr:hypothetical protein [bacterium]